AAGVNQTGRWTEWPGVIARRAERVLQLHHMAVAAHTAAVRLVSVPFGVLQFKLADDIWLRVLCARLALDHRQEKIIAVSNRMLGKNLDLHGVVAQNDFLPLGLLEVVSEDSRLFFFF